VYTCFRRDGVREGDVRNYLNLLNAITFCHEFECWHFYCLMQGCGIVCLWVR